MLRTKTATRPATRPASRPATEVEARSGTAFGTRAGVKLAAVLLLITGALVAAPGAAQASVTQTQFTFESTAEGWWFGGNANYDLGRGLAHTGIGNGWARNYTGWNSMNNWAHVVPGAQCYLGGWLRHSNTITGGYFSVRGVNGDGSLTVPLNEVHLTGPNPSNPANANYNYYNVAFNPGWRSRVLIYVGLWGNGQDSWIQADDIAVSCVY